jgi:hypothetical protein
MSLIDGAPGEVQKLTQKKLRGDHEAGSVGRQKMFTSFLKLNMSQTREKFSVKRLCTALPSVFIS